jgi:hypothetical protein
MGMMSRKQANLAAMLRASSGGPKDVNLRLSGCIAQTSSTWTTPFTARSALAICGLTV